MAQTKPIALIKVLAFSAAATLLMINIAASADTPNPFVGKWVLDVGKSTFNPPPAPKSQTITVTEVKGNTTHVTIDTVEADGSSDHLDYTSANDDKAVPVTGGNDIDSVVATLLNPRKVKTVYMKAGKTVSSSTVTVTKSGKIMRGPFSGAMPDGAHWTYNIVYARQ
jgi:hypothetical protein